VRYEYRSIRRFTASCGQASHSQKQVDGYCVADMAAPRQRPATSDFEVNLVSEQFWSDAARSACLVCPGPDVRGLEHGEAFFHFSWRTLGVCARRRHNNLLRHPSLCRLGTDMLLYSACSNLVHCLP